MALSGRYNFASASRNVERGWLDFNLSWTPIVSRAFVVQDSRDPDKVRAGGPVSCEILNYDNDCSVH